MARRKNTLKQQRQERDSMYANMFDNISTEGDLNRWNDFYSQYTANKQQGPTNPIDLNNVYNKSVPESPFYIPPGEASWKINETASNYFKENSGNYSSLDEFMEQAKRDRRKNKLNSDDLIAVRKHAEANGAWAGTKQAAQEGVDALAPGSMRKIFNKRSLNVVMNAGFAISDYKDARDQGKGVIASGVKAGALFAAGEVLQGAMLPVMLASSIPKMALSGVESAQRMTRQMNNMQRIQTFGDSYFQDTQQLSTMRQAGMEMAKMSQYNLQQSIMGNEAQYMHRL